MARSASGPAIDAIIRQGPAVWLRSRRFRRSGRSFWRPSADVVHTINFQAFRFNTPDRAEFCVNIGAEWPPCFEAWTGSPLKGNPAIAPVFTAVRLHPTRGWGQDYWWRAIPADPQPAADEVVTVLEAHAEHFWSLFSDLAAVLDRLDRGERVPGMRTPWLAHAVLLVHFNRKQEARQVLDRVRTASPDPTMIDRIAARLSLDAAA